MSLRWVQERSRETIRDVQAYYGHPVRGYAEPFTKARGALGSLPDETNTISIRLTKPKDSARTDTDTGVSDVRYCVQSVIVRPRSDDLHTALCKPAGSLRILMGHQPWGKTLVRYQGYDYRPSSL